MPRISYAQNGEDIRVWRALHEAGHPGPGLVYVDVGANEPRHLSITASLHDLGWRGLLIEADPVLAAELRVRRPGDVVIECAAARSDGMLTFHRVPGTGLGTLEPAEAEAARSRGFVVEDVEVPARPLDAILDAYAPTEGIEDIHFMSIDVEGAEADVLAGLGLQRHRPWIMCIEAVLPGTTDPSHAGWEPELLARGYRWVAFDGVNRWYVAEEHADLADVVAIPFNAVDAGEWGWIADDAARDRAMVERDVRRHAWQR